MEAINWRAMTPAQRDETIHEKVMGHERKTIQYEVPSARAGETVFIASSTTWHPGGLHIPRYSQSMDAAWLAMEKMKKANWSRFCIELDGVITQHKRGWDESTGNPYVTWFQKFVKLLNADGICVAALRGCGYEVLTEEVQQ